MREIEIRNSTKTHIPTDDGKTIPMTTHLAIDLVLPEIDGVYETPTGELAVTKKETPPGLELKGNIVGGELFVPVALNPTETDPFKKIVGSQPIGDGGLVTVYTREFLTQLGVNKLLPRQPGKIIK